MEYDTIPYHIRRRIHRTLYENGNDDVKQALIENVTDLYLNFMVVGMRFHGDHVFTSYDAIRLEREDDNSYDANAVRVMVNTAQVGYVAREDAIKIRSIENFEHKKVKWVRNYSASASLDLMLN
jgi:cobalamin biosynthesis Mg chelatase CobN